MNIINELKYLLVAGGLPVLMFVIGVVISYFVFPYDVDGASNTLMIFAGTGALIGIFMIVHRLQRLLR